MKTWCQRGTKGYLQRKAGQWGINGSGNRQQYLSRDSPSQPLSIDAVLLSLLMLCSMNTGHVSNERLPVLARRQLHIKPET